MSADAARRGLRVVVAADSFKGSLSSLEAGTAIRDGVLDASPDATVHVVAIADGGEGTIEAFRAAGPLDEVPVVGVDALGRPHVARYARRVGLRGVTAVIEAAATIGLTLVGRIDERLPSAATSRGLGLHIRDALHEGADTIIVGLGGTACTDGGVGLLMAVGATVTDAAGDPVTPFGNPLLHYEALDVSDLPDLSAVEVLTDVRSPLLGPQGASRMFGPQKGATPAQVDELETRMTRWADALEGSSGRAVRDVQGSGAAGGVGAALMACGARLTPGFDRIADEVGLTPLLASADIVFTGEGRIDAQTALGKGPSRVAEMAKEHGSAVVIGLAGDLSRADPPDAPSAFDALFPVHRGPITLRAAMDPAVTRAALRASAGQIINLGLAFLRTSSQPEPSSPVGSAAPRPTAPTTTTPHLTHGRET